MVVEVEKERKIAARVVDPSSPTSDHLAAMIAAVDGIDAFLESRE